MIEQSQKRLCVITNSILVEWAISRILCSFLDIDQENSKILGNKGSSFSFIQKLDLLLDMRHIDADKKSKLLKFAEIRNQFAHNPEAKDFTSCMNLLDGNEKYLRKTYNIPEISSLSQEEQLAKLYQYLVDEIHIFLQNLFDLVMKKHSTEAINFSKLHILEHLLLNIKTCISETGQSEIIDKYNTEVYQASEVFRIAGNDFETEVTLDEYKIV